MAIHGTQYKVENGMQMKFEYNLSNMAIYRMDKSLRIQPEVKIWMKVIQK